MRGTLCNRALKKNKIDTSLQNSLSLNSEDAGLVFDLNHPCPGLVPLHLAECEPEVPGHGVGPPGGPVIPLQVL